ncbi:methyltransferase domain-containing protein [Streptomyces sp. NBC_01716]|nr:methyltransferase domain-containing protein [Streptomyces sp. NBC_01716]
MTNTDLWHHYGRNRAERDRTVPESFHWIWSQNGGPGAEALGDLTGQRVVDLGAGSARHAAHLAALHRPAQVVAVDASAAQHAMATDLYAQLTPRLRLVHADVPAHLRMAPHTYDVLYSVFGAVDFTEPRKLLRAAFTALRPGGRLVFSTLAHYLNGEPAEADVVPAEVSAKTPGGEPAVMRRWVLQEHVWTKILDEAGFTGIDTDLLPPTTTGPHTADTLLVTASRRSAL